MAFAVYTQIRALNRRFLRKCARWSVYRFVRNLEPQLPDVTVRVEQKPGQEAQVDFGYGGWMVDPITGQMRKTWAFVMTLAWSRHQYVEFVFDQTVEIWLQCHCHAFGSSLRRWPEGGESHFDYEVMTGASSDVR
jgi:transposase